jgi:hypothetical protein
MLGYLELLQESKLNRRDSKMAETMLKSARRAVEQVGELYAIDPLRVDTTSISA